MKFIGIIPARFASTRFPGKPLVKIGDKTMIQRVYEQSAKAFAHVVVATDDQRIFEEVERFGGNAVMTSENHKSGTDRCAEAVAIYAKATGTSFDVVINIQGDEPFIQPEELQKLTQCFTDQQVQIATLVKPIHDTETILNPNSPKVVISAQKKAIYFSRSPIPYIRNYEPGNWGNQHTFYKHIGIYAYRTQVLNEITRLKPSLLELAESLEQNRWIEHGYQIAVEFTDIENIAVDTPEDLEKITKAGNF
jgi:3-deoxy-manno-octulosonate cytidylyltransferase (CMP-KDO synthetase)